ncbi:PepSY-like domain-containing protein [Aequorivita todarodis]|uniref:PepSY-like domain-containing protein n=1 Tax=Aequorivita todarodis TaxID=2036821 RepID=UPI0023508C19|nr:PepSY-like domain-containing protein [Aequorivita todarodis]MDC7999901.1 PepSY-like domain-containing protein [Aequorivita todarodis]
MKTFKIITIGMALLLTAAIQAQDISSNEVPQNFTTGLLNVYPTATDIEWEKRGTDYKVNFDVGRMEHKIWFNKYGDMVKVEKHITISQMPANLKEIIKRDYPNYKIESVESIEKDGITTFEVELDKSWNESLRITYSSNGQILKAMKD